MSQQEKQRLCVIVNPVSGVSRKRMGEFRRLVGQHLAEQLYETVIHVTRAPGHGRRIAAEALEDGIRIFVVAGGDGTVNEVADVLAGTTARLAIIPAGSGNGLAHHLGIPFRKKDALDLIVQGHTVTIDTCRVNGLFFASIAGIGFDAKVARQFANSHRRGFLTYARIVMKEYLHYKSGKYRLSLDGEEMEKEAFFISFANSNQFGYNTRISPRASITDGLIDVAVVSKPPVKAFPEIARLMYRQEIDRSKYISIYRASDILVWREKGKTVNVDGEAVRMGKKLHITISPASLNVIVPQNIKL